PEAEPVGSGTSPLRGQSWDGERGTRGETRSFQHPPGTPAAVVERIAREEVELTVVVRVAQGDAASEADGLHRRRVEEDRLLEGGLGEGREGEGDGDGQHGETPLISPAGSARRSRSCA